MVLTYSIFSDNHITDSGKSHPIKIAHLTFMTLDYSLHEYQCRFYERGSGESHLINKFHESPFDVPYFFLTHLPQDS